MIEAERSSLISLLKEEICPAMGCTEPAAVAYAAATASKTLGCLPEEIVVTVSRNILKNAMGVGIPGTGMVGLPIAACLGALCGDDREALAVLHRVTEEDMAAAQHMIGEHRVKIVLDEQAPKLYIDVSAHAQGHSARVIIEGAHTNIRRVELDGECLRTSGTTAADARKSEPVALSLEAIDRFVREAPGESLLFLRECVEMNLAIAEEGLRNAYGLAIGQSMAARGYRTEEEYATALTCAAADARMSGCLLPVMSLCGSGNQGLTAMLPVIAVCRARNLPEDTLLRALAYSMLVTIHVKRHLGKLTALCACSVGASIGTACALTYLDGGDLSDAGHCVDNVVADVAGVICDGAKAGCSLKIATGVSSAFRSAMLAMRHHSASPTDGIVGADAEASVDNLANLCNTGMLSTDRVILDMLVSK